jgi:hypothetical protein
MQAAPLAAAPPPALSFAPGAPPGDAGSAALLQWAGRLVADTAGWRPLDAEAHAAGPPVLVVGNGGAATVAFRAELGTAGVVRVRQRLQDGTPVELLVWRDAPLALSEVVVTGARQADPQRRARVRRGRRRHGGSSGRRRRRRCRRRRPSADVGAGAVVVAEEVLGEVLHIIRV